MAAAPAARGRGVGGVCSDGEEAQQRPAAPRDDHLLAGGDALDPLAEAVAKRIAADGGRRAIRSDGASRARTGDLLAASQTLSQLSYSPGEVKVSSQVNTCALLIPSRNET